jgi:hypothetical protein
MCESFQKPEPNRLDHLLRVCSVPTYTPVLVLVLVDYFAQIVEPSRVRVQILVLLQESHFFTDGTVLVMYLATVFLVCDIVSTL